MEKITTYRFVHEDSGSRAGKSVIQIWVVNTRECVYRYQNLTPERALLLLDVLRNEKPVYIDRNSGRLEVPAEPVGEGE